MRIAFTSRLAALAISLVLGGCSNSGKPATVDPAWFDSPAPAGAAKGAVVTPFDAVVSKVDKPPMTYSLWLKPLTIETDPPFDKPLPHERLKEPIALGLGLPNLPAPSAAKSRLIDAKAHEGYQKVTLAFSAEAIGSWTATLLLPATTTPEKKHPAILALHGHEEDGDDFIDDMALTELAKAGFVVLAPNTRWLGCDKAENDAAVGLYNKGLTLMGVQVFEALSAAHYLKSRPGVDSQRIGLLGHGVGGTAALLLARQSDIFNTLITDHLANFKSECGPRHVHSETLPTLLDYAESINTLDSLPIPHLLVEGGMTDAATRPRINAHILNTGPR